ncbi:hypothetical protein NW072_06335 [Mycoplasmopsis felis]|nr:hypothetical protein [Mycoplasmopsis felis]UWV79578.1 hypothetical protein NW072_06335 [Mycoplasmopsis felis]
MKTSITSSSYIVFAFVDNNQIQSKYTFPYANDSYLLNEMYLRFKNFTIY